MFAMFQPAIVNLDFKYSFFELWIRSLGGPENQCPTGEIDMLKQIVHCICGVEASGLQKIIAY